MAYIRYRGEVPQVDATFGLVWGPGDEHEVPDELIEGYIQRTDFEEVPPPIKPAAKLAKETNKEQESDGLSLSEAGKDSQD